MDVDELAALLPAAKPARRGGFVARCPAHEDDAPSLSVQQGNKGVVVHCFAGCSADAIMAALGRTTADLFNDEPEPVVVRRRRTTVYEIRDAQGELKAIHERIDHADGSKDFAWRQPNGTSGLNGTGVVDLPLYGSERIASWPQGTVPLIVEGEKDAHALLGVGVAALGTVTGAAATPSASPLGALAGRGVILAPDNDEAGRQHMQRTAVALAEFAAVGWVEWPGVPAKGGAADYLATHTADDVRQLVTSARAWPLDDETAVSAQRPNPLGRQFRTAHEIVSERPPGWRYISLPWLACGMITELDGKPKTAGKTTFVLRLIRAVLDGRPFLGGATERTPVVLLTEQSRASIAPTLAAAGLDRDDLVILSWPDTLGLSWEQIVALAVEECLRLGARLLIVDTLGQFAGVRGDSENDAGAALEAMAPLQAAAAEHDLAVLVSRHDRKGGGDIGESGRGSNAWTGAVDCVIALRRPLNPARHTIRELEAVSRRDDVPAEPLIIELVDDDYVLLDSAAVAFDEGRHALLAHLSKDPQTETEILARVRKAGGTLSRSTFQRARDDLLRSADVERTGSGGSQDPYHYRLPEPSAQSAQRIDVGQTKAGPDPGPRSLKLSMDWDVAFPEKRPA